MKMSPLISFFYIMPAKHSSVDLLSLHRQLAVDQVLRSLVMHSAMCHVFCISFTHLLQSHCFGIHYVLEALRYKSEGPGIDSRRNNWVFQLT
jgi:hypothetical protein